MIVQFKTRDSWGNVILSRFENVESWADETSPYDPYVLRVMRDKDGKAIAGPMVSELIEWEVLPC